MVRWAVVSGALVVLVGLALVPLPGPGWPVVAVGVVLLGVATAVRLRHGVSRRRR